MVAAMPRPSKNRFGVYYLRKRVPDHLRPVVGKRELIRSLGTKDLAEAKRRFPEALAWADAILGSSQNASTLTLTEIHDIAQQHQANLMAEFGDDPPDFDDELEFAMDCYYGDRQADLVGSRLDRLLDGRTVLNRSALIEVVFNAHVLALKQLQQRRRELRFEAGQPAGAPSRSTSILGDSLSNVQHVPHQIPVQSATTIAGSTPPSWDSLLDLWEARKTRPSTTLATYRKYIRWLSSWTEERPDEVQRSTFRRWRDHLLAQDYKGKTVRDALAAIKAVLQVGIEEDALPGPNPVIGVKVEVDPSEQRPFTKEEASLVMSAAIKEGAPMSYLVALMAYSGARVSEITQLRRADIQKQDGIWFMDISRRGDRSTKTTSSVRRVPIHEHVLDLGLLDWLPSDPDARLFMKSMPDKHAKWVRSLGLTDPHLAPAHGWRHWIADACRDADIPMDVAWAITGHAIKGAGAGYGRGHSLRTLAEAIKRLPRIETAS